MYVTLWSAFTIRVLGGSWGRDDVPGRGTGRGRGRGRIRTIIGSRFRVFIADWCLGEGVGPCKLGLGLGSGLGSGLA